MGEYNYQDALKDIKEFIDYYIPDNHPDFEMGIVAIKELESELAKKVQHMEGMSARIQELTDELERVNKIINKAKAIYWSDLSDVQVAGCMYNILYETTNEEVNK